MSKKLLGKTVIITGVSRGLGRGLSIYFASKGMNVVGMARNEEDLKSLEEEITSQEGIFIPFVGNVSDWDAVENMTKDVVAKFGKIDVLINNAGTGEKIDVAELSKKGIDNTIDTNLKGMVYLTRHIVPYMQKEKQGHIINISSVAGLGMGKNHVYAATKAAMDCFCRTTMNELMKDGIYISHLNSGGIDTTWWDNRDVSDGFRNGLMSSNDLAEIIEFIITRPKHMFIKQIVFPPRYEVENYW